MQALVLAALVLWLAGCGGSDTLATNATSEAYEVSETDFELEPPSLTVDAQGEVTLTAVNDGETAHALAIEGPDLEEETKTITPGESAEVTVDLKSGSYTMYCPISNHRELGMEGTIVVGGAGSAGTLSTRTDETEDSGYDQG